MALKREPGWRDAAAGGLVAKHVGRLPSAGRALVMEDPSDIAAHALADAGLEVERWWRRAGPGRPATGWPEPDSPVDVVALRLPKAKDELEMAVHAAASCLVPEGTLVVYGAKDEGIGSAHRRIESLLRPVHTLATGGHCRLLAARRPRALQGVRARLADWRIESVLDLTPAGSAPPIHHPTWVSYPGVFAHGRLDEGTRMLIRTLPVPDANQRILDFGCGSGVLAAVCSFRAGAAGRTVQVDGLDTDAVALVAFGENVTDSRAILADGLADLPDAAYTWIVSNPPYHVGKAESTAVLSAFVDDAVRVLARPGRLTLVTQRRMPVEDMLIRAFGSGRVRALASDAIYQVWEARRE